MEWSRAQQGNITIEQARRRDAMLYRWRCAVIVWVGLWCLVGGLGMRWVSLRGRRLGPSEAASALASRANPNSAPAGALMRLPGIGPSRARAIVLYRDEQKRGADNVVVFSTWQDLTRVNGIGPKTAQALMMMTEEGASRETQINNRDNQWP